MRAFQVTDFKTPPALTDCPQPEPGPGEIGVAIKACGLNFADLLMAQGAYQDTPAPPFTLGMEVAGVIEALGEGVSGWAPGDRVAVFGGQGGLAEFGCFSARHCIGLPEAVGFSQAAAFQVAYGTSHLALAHRARLKEGETLLVTGASGGVGLTAVELGAQMGARVIAAARGVEKLEIAREAGAHHLIDMSDADLREAVRALGGADVVYEAIGGDVFTAAMRATNPEGRILAIGFASGDVPKIPANHLLVKNIDVLGVYWGGYLKFRPETLDSSLKTLLEWLVEGRITPHISAEFPLEEAGAAMELMRSRRSTGKVVVTIDAA